MIPQQLKLRNFLSYGSHTQTIDFTDHHLICLSGKNGHGKSALLDAITWVLWGQARKVHATAKADSGLVCLGQTHMMVSLDFLCNGKRYRAKREFTHHNGKTQTTLDFGIANEDGSTFTSLNEKTTRGTQEKITHVIGLDYESCINSVFLRQGQSNEFSQKSAKERKEILATILGINRFEETRKQAAEKAKTALQAKEQLAHFLEQLIQEVAKKNLLEQECSLLAKKLTEQTEQEKTHRQLLKKNELQQQEIREKIAQKKLFDFQLQQLDQTSIHNLEKLRSNRDAWRATRRQQQLQQQVCSPEQLTALEQEEQALEQQYTLYLKLKEQFLTEQDQLATITTQLKKEHATYEQALTTDNHQKKLALVASAQELERIKKSIAEHTLAVENAHNEKNRLAKELKKSDQHSQALETSLSRFERKKNFYYRFVAAGNRLTDELKKLAQTDLLQQQQLNHCSPKESLCPLCEHTLTLERKEFLQKKLAKKTAFYEHQMARLKKIIPQIKHQLVKEHTENEHLKKQSNEYLRFTEKVSELTTTINRLEKELSSEQQILLELQKKHARKAEECAVAEKKLFEHTQPADFADKVLKNNVRYQEALKLHLKTEKKLAEIIYNAARHQEIKKQLKTVREQANKTAQLAHEVSLQEQRKNIVYAACKELKELKLKQRAVAKELLDYATLPETQVKLEKEREQLKITEKSLITNKEELVHKKGGLEQQLATLKQREQEVELHTKRIATYDEDIEDYQEIAQALSKNGIQALLIENALPEIEHEANNLLSKLTDNQSHIIIESLRDLKSGGTRETLDIKISDAMGIRPYELFSGGEAFRIDFALRIAISKLLARRSGTSLQTLIIDEGFGSQDEDGLAHIMEALYKIQDEFAKIIIVSHLPTMKNQFPTHFIVHKSAAGSTVTVMQQG